MAYFAVTIAGTGPSCHFLQSARSVRAANRLAIAMKKMERFLASTGTVYPVIGSGSVRKCSEICHYFEAVYFGKVDLLSFCSH